jgi:hypothetical protein
VRVIAHTGYLKKKQKRGVAVWCGRTKKDVNEGSLWPAVYAWRRCLRLSGQPCTAEIMGREEEPVSRIIRRYVDRQAAAI